MKIKEKIKKIGNRKYCLLLALLILALLFTVLMPKINLGTQKASALSAPQTKTLDLNGESYSYQTSLNELKNNYGFFNYKIGRKLLVLMTDTEGTNYATVCSSGGIVGEQNRPIIAQLLKNNIILNNNNNKKYDGDFLYDNTDSTDNPCYNWADDNNEFNLNKLTSVEINIPSLLQNPFVDDLSKYVKACNVSFYYIKNGLSYPAPSETIYNNTIIKNYFFTKPLNYIFNIEKIDGYSLNTIDISFENDIKNLDNDIFLDTFYNKWPSYDNYDSFGGGSIGIKNLEFINNNESNILKYDISFWNYLDNQGEEVFYQGSLLLSNTKSDTYLFDDMMTDKRYVTTQSFSSPVFFGSDRTTKITNISFRQSSVGINPFVPGAFNIQTQNDVICTSLPNYADNNLSIKYYKQNQLLYVPEAQDIRITSEIYNGAGLSAQVEDVLYNVEYLGNTEKIQQEEEIKKDFENMLYVTGAFAVIGLLLGFVFGNPILGLVIGAAIGFGLTIIPIILDGLQAIFGQGFLDGLQNFFRTIASSIANVVSSILNFLFGIITNPAVLVLVLIVAILYLFVFRNKE